MKVSTNRRVLLRHIAACAFAVGLALPIALRADGPATDQRPSVKSEKTGKDTLIKRKKPQETGSPAEKPAEKNQRPLDADVAPLKRESKATPADAPPAGKTAPAPEDEALLRSLDPTKNEPGEDDVERLERAIAGMREAQQRIEGKDAGKKTQEIQQRVVRDLATLIDALQKPQPPSANQNQQDQDDDQQKQSKRKRKRRLTLRQRRQLAEQQQAQSNVRRNQRDRDKSPDTSETQTPRKTAKTEQDRQQDLVKDVWGHLPPNVRAELLNVFSEKYLPKYEDLVRRYYEALAEKNRQKSRGR